MEQELFTVKVVSGEHEGRHRSYKAGEIFRTQYPLHTMFPNKFELLPNTPAPIEEGPDTISAVQAAQEAARATKEPPLQGPVPPAPMSPYGEYAPHNIEEFDFEGAKKVTAQFKDAKEFGLDVWTTGSGDFAVTEAGAKVLTNLAPSVLKSKKEVRSFLASMKVPEVAD